MQTWPLQANANVALEQSDSFRFGYFIVIAPAGASPGAPVSISAGGSANAPYPPQIGIKFPWDDPSGPFWGPFAIDSTGALSNPAEVQITIPENPSGPLVPEGLLVASAITATGVRNPLGGYVCSYEDPVSPVAPPTIPPGISLLVSVVLASRQTKVPVADWRTQSIAVTFIAYPPYSSPEPVTIWSGECLNLLASQNIAAALGGTVVQVVPPSNFTAYANPVPTVNGIQFTYQGVLMQAVAGEVAQAFDQSASNLQAAILACFTPVTQAQRFEESEIA